MEAELQFIKECWVVFEPIAQALDRLQGDKQCFYDELLPTILSTHRELSQLGDDTTGIMRCCLPLVHAVCSRFENHFFPPFFNLRWAELLNEC